MLEELRRNDIRVPADMSVVGFDDTTLAGLVTPKLTTVRQDATELGRIGTARLLDALAAGTGPAARRGSRRAS
jgi:DNA-binding LacI/PurR family transcriptional regulator